jgi:acetoin utilization deacetylase AcuC-like enzyme
MPALFVYHPNYTTPLPDGHRFPMQKFARLYQVLIEDGVATLDQFHLAPLARREWLILAHDAAHVDAYLGGSIDPNAMRRIGFPWSPALVQRTCTALGGTVLAAQLALQHGLACNCAGGTHHAHSSFGSGFCIFNDLGVAPRVLQQMGLVRQVLIVDLDVHQGDGTAQIFQQDASVFTFSMHCANNFPFRKAHSDLDVELPVGADDALYLRTLAHYLPDLLSQVKPDIVFYDAGVDPHTDDILGKLSLSDQGLYQRDCYVLVECLRRGIPVAGVIGGGYDKDIDRLARRHSILHRSASDVKF